MGEHVLGGRRGRQHRHPGAEPGKQPQDVALDAVVDGHDVEFGRRLLAEALVPHPRRLGPLDGLAGGDLPGEVEVDEAVPCGRAGRQRRNVEIAVGIVGDDGVGRTLLADQRGERACVAAGHGDDAALLQPGVEVAFGPVVGRGGDAAP